MICGIATSTPRSGKADALTSAALEHAGALRLQPGCVGAWVMWERGGTAQLSLSIFDTDDTFNRALEVTRPVIAKHRLGELVEGEPTFRVFDVHPSP
jgi:heme-degrading monooxygenase HmoA